ncbi:ATP-binding protein [Altererythrobacter sp. ZODW24]|uniref:sensor histidine kinase n=1 Tax=Altererythrobacter sp. ZODW24 TaxID=2185142 RepID=UPI000DF76F12|nr:ATP-binding protein [Altererythrobacter sp. ZODW24]
MRFWPKSLRGQVLAALALALIVAQGVNLVLLQRSQMARQDGMVANSAAFRLLSFDRRQQEDRPQGRERRGGPGSRERRGDRRGALRDIAFGAAPTLRPELTAETPQKPGERRQEGVEVQVAEALQRQGVSAENIVAVRRQLSDEPEAEQRIRRRAARAGINEQNLPRQIYVIGVQPEAGAQWRVVHVAGARERNFRGFGAILLQTVLLFFILFGALALILGRITRPLAALTQRSEEFARDRNAADQIEPSGPADVSQLIMAHNDLETKIAGLLDEKDVMLGAIGHDLKTPLAALRVRIESVSDETERARMAETIDGIAGSLDDILSLARVGRPTDPLESVELGALAASIVEEYEDLGEPVTVEESERMVGQMRASWVRRALRNLISNALRYGGSARVSLTREASENGDNAILLVEDDGPGIPAADIGRMMEPFTRGEPSRNKLTGGAGLGLTLARAIAEQHGGTLKLVNLHDDAGNITGLAAKISLPLG